MTKYNSQKMDVDGIEFDSKKEARRWCELRLLEKAGAIKDLKRQVKFVLIPTQKTAGKTVRECAYVADFVYNENGKTVVEDTKGFKTKDYLIKRKLMLWVHGISIKEV